MDIQEIIAQLKDKFGDKVDVAAVTEHFKDQDTSKFSFAEIIEKVKGKGLVGDLDGDGIEESTIDEIKGKISSLFGK